MELEEKIKTVLSFERKKSEWKNNHSSNEWKLSNDLSEIFMKEPLKKTRNCGCVDDLFIMLNSLNKTNINNIKIKIMSDFKIKPGKVIMLHGFVDQLTEHNVTDEKALLLLKSNPKHIKFFEQFPKDWEKQAEEFDPKVKGAKNPEANAGGNGSTATREDELLSMSVENLRTMADDLAEVNEVSVANKMCGVKGLVKFILENEAE